ncbi:MAG: trimethylamine methyltransferase family protein, partial [Pseudomonadota bacterium]
MADPTDIETGTEVHSDVREAVQTEARAGRRGRGGGGAAARRAERTASKVEAFPYISRKIALYDILDTEAMDIIEANADTVLEEVGIEFRDDAEALAMWKDAGADVQGERVHFPKGLCRELMK